MSEFGHLIILAALAVAAFGALAGPLGVRLRSRELVLSSQNAVLAVAGLLTVALVTLAAAFLSHDFSLRYVAERSSRDMPTPLVWAALYSGQEGSLLFWAWGLGLFSTVAVLQNRQTNRELLPWVTLVLLSVQTFFLVVLSFVTNPFERLPVAPPDGLGLNPLLYDFGMLIHPPLLLSGYMSWTVPFAFGVAALITGRLSSDWIRSTRRYALFAWAVLGAGNLMGAWWAYHVLGWGGYWGWDPVENVAILPWLTGTAYLHSVMVQERRGMLKVWNLALLLLTGCLAIFGTFVVRSGVISSVHSFAQSAIGPYYLAFLGLLIVTSVALLFWRMPRLRAENQLDSLLSREAAFLLNNLLFLAVVFATFWGTIFPLVSEALQGVKLTVGPPYFQQVNGPLLLALLLLMGIGPLLPWRRASPEALRRSFLPPLGAGLAVVALLVALGVRQPVALGSFLVCGFVAATIVLEFARGARARHRATGEPLLRALASLVRRNSRRYGGYVVHLGVVIIAAAVIGSHFYQVEAQDTLQPGESLQIGGYTLTFEGLRQYTVPGIRIVDAAVTVSAGGRVVDTLHPEKRFHRNFERQPSSGVAIRSTALEDLYVVLVGWEDSGAASFLVFINPLVSWLWVGGAVLILGTVILLWPEPAARPALATRPLPGAAVSGAPP